MFIARLWRWLCIFFIAISFSLSGTELLQTKDVNKIMQQIFEQHVDKKEITASIIKSSFKVYIDQFDPDRIYLLEEEIKPFTNIPDADLNRILAQYKQNQFPEYTDLNNVIQKAIYRARQVRSGMTKGDTEVILQKSSSYSADGYEEWRDPDLKRPFPKNEKELTERIKQHLVQFLASERKRFGDSYIINRSLQTFKIFENEARGHENQYLFLTDHGLPMNEAEMQNAFTIHILKALANSLDAHTTVLSSSEAFDMRLRLEKEVQGIGVELHTNKNGIFVISKIVEGGPAAKSGLIKIDDQLLEIDNMPLRDKSLNEATEMLRGKNGTKVSLLLKRSMNENGLLTTKTLPVLLTRDEITVNEDRVQTSFETFGAGIIGKIKLDSFYQSENGVTSENDIREAIQKLDKKGNLRGLILDLRENSGGFLSQSVKVVGLFITNGVVVISKYFNGDEHFYRDMDGKKAFDGPLIVLTSKATASAAEIVAQALQDYGVALVVGDEHTYGKGSIQSQTVTENQGSAFFKVTVGKYYTVSGKTPQIQGVKADIVVPSQFYHENIGEEYLENPLKQDVIADEFNDDLQDIAPNLKPWYMHYYLPSIQHKRMVWKEFLPTLKKNSEYRIAHNKNYQMFLKGTVLEQASMGNSNQQSNFGSEDLSMSEAVNILKDMILLETQTPTYEPSPEVVKK